MTKILIVGMAPDREPAWLDKSYDQVYAMPWDDEATPHADVLFEMHDRSLWEKRGSDYRGQLDRQEVRVVMQRAWPDIKHSCAFPQALLEDPEHYYNSSIAYMFTYAMLHAKASNRPEIHLVGCALTDGEEYSYQRPNMEYLIGYARGLGIEVEVLGESSLLKFHPNIMFLDEMITYKERYGYL